MAVFCGFQPLRMLCSSAFIIDNRSRKRHTLPALGLAAERAIGLASTRRTVARGSPHVPFANCIAYADNHR
jgi:hypothetical protein